MLTLTLKDPPAVPLEAEVLSPDVLAGKSAADVRGLPVFLGKRQLRVDDLFAVEGDGGDDLTLRGDLRKVKWVGKGMTRGRITIHGSAGMHLGAHMTGGSIEVHGDADDWLGAEMGGGTIRVRGNVGAQAAAAYRGGITGMSGGTLLIDGTAGIELGMRMRRGLIAVRGPVGDFAGFQMKGGTVVLLGGAGRRTGAWMLRGTILALAPVELLPTFAYCCDLRPTFLRLYARHLAAAGFPLPGDGLFRRYAGDAAVPGKGEVLVPAAS